MKYQVFVTKKAGFDLEAKAVAEGVKIVNHYLIESPEKIDIDYFAKNVLAEATVDEAYTENFDFSKFDFVIPIRYLPAQYDQRADFAAQVLEIMSGLSNIRVRSAKVYCFDGGFTKESVEEIKSELINPIESMEVRLQDLNTFENVINSPTELKPIEALMKEEENLNTFIMEHGLAMSTADLEYIVKYFKSENRAPNILEIKALDTYWSDHCRHSTFNTKITDIKLDPKDILIQNSLDEYYHARKQLKRDEKPLCLMDLATINSRYHIDRNKHHNIDLSEEINACSININCKMPEGDDREALLMFKNETHNHPTEIEPYGGAATCLGGAIRDPLSGRAYVYGAMRISGAADPRKPKRETLAGKLPQYKICRDAAKGYSSYGNQIGLATGLVREFYHPGFLAKRFELGAVIAACPKENVLREVPKEGDLVLLLGGRTGRDGIGGATGSSKSHTDESLLSSGGEVQKGNPPTERKLQRLFMNPRLAKMIKRCNDFGAGGVAVAVGEIADSIDIDLDKVPTKYDGLNPLETAISESQERMAIVIDPKNKDEFLAMCREENLEATVIAKVSSTGRLRMFSKGEIVLDLSRDFLDSGGITGEQSLDLNLNRDGVKDFFNVYGKNLHKNLNTELSKLQNASQKGLIEMFDSSIGSTGVFYPLGGKNRLSPNDVMVNRIPLEGRVSETLSAMSFGYDPDLAMISPFHAGYYAVIMSISKLVAAGFPHNRIKLSLQEYFEKLGKDEKKWAKPFLALLGAMKAEFLFDAPAIGGKDSMSGTFNEINVPPSLVSFAVSYGNEKPIINLFQDEDSSIYVILPEIDGDALIAFEDLKTKYDAFLKNRTDVLSARAVDNKGVLVNLFEMAVGNACNIKLDDKKLEKVREKAYGAILLQSKKQGIQEDLGAIKIGEICKNERSAFCVGEESYSYTDLIPSYTKTLENVYPIVAEQEGKIDALSYNTDKKFIATIKPVKPKVFIPAFPGSNCEIDTARAFETAGAEANIIVFRNQNETDIKESIEAFEKAINDAQILAIPGGFSAGDEPEGSAKFITAVLRNPRLKNAINKLIKDRDGLVIGICNGFQALIKLGVFDKGELGEIDENSPTLTYNKIGRHISNIVKLRIASNNSPWLSHVKPGDVFNVAISHGEGRFACKDSMMKHLIENHQVCTQYCDENGRVSMDPYVNPNGSKYAVEGLISKDGRVLGKMGHTERYLEGLYQNIDGDFDKGLFKSGVEYFK